MRKVIWTIIAILIIALIAGGFYLYKGKIVEKIEEIKPDDKSNLIVVFTPLKDAEISSPLSISGRARGNWYFEGSFPIVLEDAYGNTVAEGHATAQGEWTTAEFVPFLATLQFNNYIPDSKGKLILKKDNPSGLTKNDDSIVIPITFK